MFDGATWSFILAAIRAATPLMFCALSIVLAERAGVMNISVEGMMLGGALAGVLGVVFFGDAYIGITLTVMVGIIAGLIMSLITVYLPSNQIVSGLVFNIFMLGLTSFVFRYAAIRESAVQALIPRIDLLFLDFSPFFVAVIPLMAAMWWFLFRTGPGLKVRSVGENASAAHAAGIDVLKVRLLILVIAGILAALGGSALTMGWVRSFTDNVTMGRGFIALAAAYAGRWNPLLAVGACIIFGAGEALAFRAGAIGLGISSYYFLMIPYLLTLLVIGVAGRSRAPADVGKPYIQL